MLDNAKVIAVFGSWRSAAQQEKIRAARGIEQPSSNNKDEDLFRLACAQLGADIAEQGHKLLIASDSPRTVDYHVVKGILKLEPQPTPPIQLIRSKAKRSSQGPETCEQIYSDAMGRSAWAFSTPILLSDAQFLLDADGYASWTAVHEHMVEMADSVLVIGGGSSTHHVANFALANRKYLVPVGSFGGAASDILEMLKSVRDISSVPTWEYRQALSGPNWNDRARDVSLFALGVRTDPDARRSVFINYRRSDASSEAERVHYGLEMELQIEDDRFFLDIESIDAGKLFKDEISKVLRRTKVFVTLIGPTWLSAADSSHRRRLDQPDDYVCTEIELALKDSEITVIPILVRDAKIPKREELPVRIQSLIDRNFFRLEKDDPRGSISRLADVIKEYLGEG